MQTNFTWRGLSRVMLTGTVLVGLGFGCGSRTTIELDPALTAVVNCGDGECKADEGESC
jgi:hypothetical protein